MSVISKFRSDRRGNIAIIFALALMPLCAGVGAAVDYSRATAFRTDLMDALDAGVLAVGSQSTMKDDDAYKIIDAWMTAHLGDQYGWHLDSVTQDDGGAITAMASAKVETTLSRVLGIDEIPIGVTSQAVRSTGKVELALVLDNTGSMKGTKISKLKTAAADLVDALAKAAKDPKDLKISLVPFSQTVNVGSTYAGEKWIDAAGNSATARSLFLGQTVNRFDLFKKVGATWGGCVESRTSAYEATDTTPDTKKPDTLYVPYFAPDEPGTKGEKTYNNSYLKDSKVSAVKTALTGLGLTDSLSLPDFRLLQGDIAKYSGSPQTGATNALGYQYGPNSGCEIAPLQRLSTDTATVKTAIGKMIANGNTDIPMGLAWGWNTLSPDGPFKDGSAYHNDEWQKYAVLMTDGNNENEVGNAEDDSYNSGVGYVWQGRMGITAGDKAARTKARDKTLEAMCQAMKEDGIVIFTVRVEVKTGSSSVLSNCASDDKKFYDVQNVADLNAAFKDIGETIQALRLAE
ncbi:MAG: TadE/TadG family type IV pilus assembly protein [Bauldia sp.]